MTAAVTQVLQSTFHVFVRYLKHRVTKCDSQQVSSLSSSSSTVGGNASETDFFFAYVLEYPIYSIKQL